MLHDDNTSVNYFLSDISTADKPWDTHKDECVRISNALSQNKSYANRGYSLNQCADWLLYTATENPDKPLVLSNANFCRDRACPICQWRRSLRWVATMHQQLPAVQDKYSTHRWLFLTLTVRNCDIAELRSTIQAMNQAFKSFIRKLKKRLPSVGYIRTTEITRGKDDTAHPHFHCMLLVPSDYFAGRGYIKQTEWVQLWQDALKCDYLPVVDIRAVKQSKNTPRNAQNARISSAIAETMKYSVKPSDLLKTAKNAKYGDFGWLYEYLRQVKGLRFIVIGGVLRGLIKAEWVSKDETDKDLIQVGDSETEFKTDEPLQIRFDYDRTAKRYKH